MTGTPVALDKSPSAGYVHGVPGIAEAVVLEAHTWLVTSGLRITLDHDTVQPGIAALNKFSACTECKTTGFIYLQIRLKRT